MSWGSLEIHRKQERNRALAVSGALFIGFLIVTEQVMTKSYIYRLDHKIEALKHHTFRGLPSHILLALDDLGLRSFTATCLIITALLIAYRFKSWRPINLSVCALLLLNGVVGLSKLIFGRTKPRLNMDYLHQGGLSYPSGHASNALLTWGMLAYLIYTYSKRPPFKGLRLYPAVGVITATVCVVSLIRKTHWFSDLLGGVFLGGSLLVFLIAIDRAWPSRKQPS
jgi:membrane-associated phospholipid phosphatase